MKTLKTLIIDDEQNTREVINTILRKHCPQVNILGEANSMASGLTLIREQQPDLVLLDIHLGDGSGFDLLQKLEERPFRIIFITAFESYAIKAFKFSATDYILKPINSIELVSAVNRVSESLNSALDATWQSLHRNFQDIQKNAKKLVLKTFDSIFSISLSDIIRCEADAYYTRFFLQTGQVIMVSQTLKYYDELLTEFGFFRIHQSHLINLEHFAQFKKTDGGSVILHDGSEVPVSLRRKEFFLKAIENL